jgi:hypothetical protein
LQGHLAGGEKKMDMAKVPPHSEDRAQSEEGHFNSSEVLQQLERIVSGKHFRNSKRYPSFLRFVVEQTLAGKTDALKERILGASVFGRPDDYDTNDDPIVRVTAGEIRKRIAQYYQEPGHEEELRIDLPLGSYVPHFLPATHVILVTEHDQSKEHPSGSISVISDIEQKVVGPEALVVGKSTARIGRWEKVLLALLVIAVTFFVATFRRNYLKDQGINYFWQPIIASSAPTLIVIGVHSLDERGQDEPNVNLSPLRGESDNMLVSMVRSGMVPISDIVSYSHVTDLLTRRAHPYRTKGSSDTTLEDLRQGPIILIGGLDNIWTKRLVAPLRFSFVAPNQLESKIRDNKDPSHVWKFDNMQLVAGDSRDYAIVASYFDPTIGQHVIVVAGIGKAGTQAAAEFITSDQDMKSWLLENKVPSGKNVELVLSTEILDGQPGPPHVIMSSIW